MKKQQKIKDTIGLNEENISNIVEGKKSLGWDKCPEAVSW